MKLKYYELKQKCPEDMFDFKTTDEIDSSLEGIIGQERAVDAIDLGLRVKQSGYNIYISGITGTGRTTYAKAIANKKAKEKAVPPDLCYVFNFKNNSEPKALTLPPGIGEKLCNDMENLIEELQEEIPKAFKSEEYETKKISIINEYQNYTNKLIEDLENEIAKDNFILQHTGHGAMPNPVPVNKHGQIIQKKEFQELPEKKRKVILEKSKEIQDKIEQLRRVIRDFRLEAQAELDKLDKEYGLAILEPVFENLREKYQECREIIEYLNDVREDIITNLEKFSEDKEENGLLVALQQQDDGSFFTRYKVNLLVNNKERKHAPVVVESNPTYYNLFGKIEGRSHFGTITTDFTMIKAGAVHRANGGYLIINARDLLQKPFAWETLKRVLLNREITVENIGEQYRSIPISVLKPEGISIDIKVILIGSPEIYQLLYYYDEEFKKLFKIKADFDIEMKKDENNIHKFAAVIATICRREGICHLTARGVARLVEYSCRLTEDREKLSTRFNEILEILYEANALADISNKKYIDEDDISKAIQEKDRRSNLYEEKIHEMIEKGHILIDLEGEKVGQINGLSVLQAGQYSFGRPSRITARTHLGQEGIINIEREAKMSGNIHNKAVLILSGYLGGKYTMERPLNLSASLAFEQSYGGVEGDSASCAELIALLSSISSYPVKQSLAITGSLNQMGYVQPVGGVNEKIEGFFKICQLTGLNGEQGVVIPEQNVDNLMLSDAVIEAVKENKFSIYTVKDIDEAIELMMGRPAEEVHKKVEEVLSEYADKAVEYSHSEEKDEDELNNEQKDTGE